MLPAFHGRAEEAKIPLFINGADVKDVLLLYEKWTGRKVWVTLDLRGPVFLRVEGIVSKPDAIRLLRTLLLENYGVELRDSGEKEAFATWSEDPKYKAVRAALIKANSSNPNVGTQPASRVRILDPKDLQK
jgi:hypothetical protein